MASLFVLDAVKIQVLAILATLLFPAGFSTKIVTFYTTIMAVRYLFKTVVSADLLLAGGTLVSVVALAQSINESTNLVDLTTPRTSQ